MIKQLIIPFVAIDQIFIELVILALTHEFIKYNNPSRLTMFQIILWEIALVKREIFLVLDSLEDVDVCVLEVKNSYLIRIVEDVDEVVVLKCA